MRKLLSKVVLESASTLINTAVAERAHVKRENLYRMLSKRGNPELASLFNILHGMGLRLIIQPGEPTKA